MESIRILKGIDRARKNPLVFFQSHGIDGYKNAIKEIIKFAIEEIGTNEQKNIVLELLSDNVIKITMERKGLELDKHYPEGDIYDWQLVFTELFGRNELIKDKLPIEDILSGLPSTFVSAVQFCSEYMNVNVTRNNQEYKLHFENGMNIGGLQCEKIKSDEERTVIEFKLDKDILGEAKILDAIEYFEIMFDGCSVVATNICFILRFYKGKYAIERAYRKGYRCR